MRESSSAETAAATGVDPDLALARSGDDAAFSRIVEPLRHELHAHCYRMLGSVHDADDALQDALIRAWKGVGRFEGPRSGRSWRAWLYTVATRTCLDAVQGRNRRALPMDLGPSSAHAVLNDVPSSEVSWLGPYPDRGLRSGSYGPDAAYEQREAVELAFVAALAHLPGNQRAALLLFEVLDFSAAEIGVMMRTSASSVNSALQRARATLTGKLPTQTQQQALRMLADSRLREIIGGYTRALERGDSDALVALLTEDVTWSMPPLAHWYRGIDAVTDFAQQVPLASCGFWRHLPCESNGQAAVASYLRAEGETLHRAFAINVLTLRADKISEVTTFIGVHHFKDFGLPDSLA